MSPSALSHSMRSLEQRLGARLLHRTTRSVAPTEAGQALLDRLGAPIAEVIDAVRETGALHPWRFDGPDEPFEVMVDSVVTANDTSLLLDAALRGCGVALLVESLVETHLAQGSLQRVLDRWCKPFPGFHLYYPSRRHLPAAMRALIDSLKL